MVNLALCFVGVASIAVAVLDDDDDDLSSRDSDSAFAAFLWHFGQLPCTGLVALFRSQSRPGGILDRWVGRTTGSPCSRRSSVGWQRLAILHWNVFWYTSQLHSRYLLYISLHMMRRDPCGL